MSFEFEVYEVEENTEYSGIIDKWSCGLWYDDFEESGISRCYVAVTSDSDFPIGWQTTNCDNFCVAIEVQPDYQGQGVAIALIEESGSWRPEQNVCREFWDKIRNKFGNQ